MRTGYIYKLVKIDGSVPDCYVGSTVNMKKRMKRHQNNCNYPAKEYYTKVYQFIRDNGGMSEWEMIELEKIEFEEDIELRIKEQEWSDKLGSNLNDHYPIRSKQQWAIDNVDYLTFKSKLYREANRDKIAEKGKIYREANRDKITEKGKIYREENKDKIREQKKEYREENKDKIREHKKEYREENKDKIREHKHQYHIQNAEKIRDKVNRWYDQNRDRVSERNRTKIVCNICGESITKCNLRRHQKSNNCKPKIDYDEEIVD
jgi:hypothetical protein